MKNFIFHNLFKNILLFFAIFISTEYIHSQIEPDVLWVKRFVGTDTTAYITNNKNNTCNVSVVTKAEWIPVQELKK